jgi:amylosucrase
MPVTSTQNIERKETIVYNTFLNVLNASKESIVQLYNKLYAEHALYQEQFEVLLATIKKAFTERPDLMKQKDLQKNANKEEAWFLSNTICGMSLYVDRFCDNLKNTEKKLPYFEELGVNFLHLMPLFESPANESDGGYAVSNFRKVDTRFGTIQDLQKLADAMHKKEIYLMLDIVLNHTSQMHEWAMKAKAGDKKYQDYFYFFDDRNMPDALDKTMPEVFPESAPGSFTYVPELDKWVMTVFHNYQWDLNFRNPAVFNEMLSIIFFYANLGVDILRIDAPAFLWKQAGTTSQNLEEAHVILQLIKECVNVATPGMALLAEAIVAPQEIMKYFGTGNYKTKESDFAYNATQMALQWDALATGDVSVMLKAQYLLLEKPFGTSWITYTRCHDDIGLAYDDKMIADAGFNPYEHRKFLKNYYSDNFDATPAKGALFSVNDKTGDARISGSLAALCGLEKAIEANDSFLIDTAIKRIALMQAMSCFIGGVPMLFYGDEIGYINDYTFLKDDDKSYDNRWMHRPKIDWEKNALKNTKDTIEYKIFTPTQKLLAIRKEITVLSDKKNLTWIETGDKALACFLRAWENKRVYCIFNFSNNIAKTSWFTFKQNGMQPTKLYDYWSEQTFDVKYDNEFLELQPYQFMILEPK